VDKVDCQQSDHFQSRNFEKDSRLVPIEHPAVCWLTFLNGRPKLEANLSRSGNEPTAVSACAKTSAMAALRPVSLSGSVIVSGKQVELCGSRYSANVSGR